MPSSSRSRIALAALAVVVAGVAGALIGGWSSDDESSAAPAGAPIPSAGDRYATELTAELGELAQARARLLARLRSSESARAQAQAAGVLAREYADTADRVGELGAPAEAVAEAKTLAAALRRTAGAYRRLAAAAGAERADAYERRRAAIPRAEVALRRAVAGTLDAAGASP